MKQPVKSFPRAGIFILGVGLLFTYMGFLMWGGHKAEADLVVVYTAGTPPSPTRHPATGRLSWADPAALQAAIESIRATRGSAPTTSIDTQQPQDLQFLDVGGHVVALVGLGPHPPHELAATIASHSPPVSLAVVGTTSDPETILAAFSTPTVVLPAAFGPGVPGEPQLRSQGNLIAPWVDSRFQLGQLRIRLSDESAPQIEATASALRLTMAPDDAPTIVGTGPSTLSHDLARVNQDGLVGEVARLVQHRTGADLVLINYYSARGPLIGPVSIADVETALPFRNQIVLLTMTGEDIITALAPNKTPDSSYLVHRGLDPATLKPDQTVRVATIDYLADGARGTRSEFMRSGDRMPTGLLTDRLVLDLLDPPPSQ